MQEQILEPALKQFLFKRVGNSSGFSTDLEHLPSSEEPLPSLVQKHYHVKLFIKSII
jgi:hypothetical protein